MADEDNRVQCKLAIVTCKQFAHFSEDDKNYLSAFEGVDASLQPVPVVWDDASVEWSSFHVIVVRTVWDYVEKYDAFGAWLDVLETCERGGAIVMNSVAILRWNAHKSYLLDLAGRGIPTMDTDLLPCGTRATEIERRMIEHEWEYAVIKPAVGSFGAKVSTLHAGAIPSATLKHAGALLQNEDLLLQPFSAAVRHIGEVTLIFVDGEFVHCVHKQPPRGDFKVQGGKVTPHEATPAQVRAAVQAMAAVPGKARFGRVDFLPKPNTGGDSVEWLVSEIEVLDPEMFFRFSPASCERFARMVKSACDLAAPPV